MPAYQAELCDPEKRGRLVSSEPLFVGLGIQVAYWFDYGLGHVNTSLGWRLPIAIQIVPPIVRPSSFFTSQSCLTRKGHLHTRAWSSRVPALPLHSG